ncbi:MAG: 23S rRNA pseudouridine(955/2504/2580) synthase RluC [Pseudomonadota bacterium]
MTKNDVSKNAVSWLTIEEHHVGQRIDNFLQTHLKGVPKSHVYRILRRGEVRVNKGRVKPTYRLQIDDIVRLPPVRTATPSEPVKPSSKVLQQLADSVLHEEEHFMIINKPSGMAVHGGSGISIGVIEGLRALLPNAPYLELVHRLDRDTSGCLIIAKKASMLKQFHLMLRENKLRKRYVALVKGQWPAKLKQVDAPLRKNVLRSGERIVRVDEQGKHALSRFERRERFNDATLMQINIVTGRTHQIRVHTAHTDHPIAGDEKYGDEVFNQQMRERGLKRLFLHAEQVVLPLEGLRQPLKISAPLPADLAHLLSIKMEESIDGD